MPVMQSNDPRRTRSRPAGTKYVEVNSYNASNIEKRSSPTPMAELIGGLIKEALHNFASEFGHMPRDYPHLTVVEVTYTGAMCSVAIYDLGDMV